MSASVHPLLTDCHAYPRPQTRSVVGWISRAVGRWRARLRERRALADLDYRDLRDMGVSRWEVERELAKPFWRG